MEGFLNSLSEQGGLLGTLLAIAIIMIGILCGVLYKAVAALLSEKDKRVSDANTFRQDLVEPIEKQGKAFDELGKSFQELAREVRWKNGNGNGL